MSNSNAEIRSIFCEALELTSEEAVNQYLDRVCAEDPRLRNHIEELINTHRGARNFLGAKAGTSTTCEINDPVGQQIGPYKLREKIGEGGVGVVYVGEQKEPVSRKVALKVIKPGMDSKDIISRFEAERQALAMMEHPNVAKVLDAGATEAGRPYFVMELVHGVAITEYCDSKKLTNRQRLELFIDVCHAVQHAHQKGIIHRDLKPTNIMVTKADHRAIVKVIDFGVAKALHQNLTDKSIYTGYGQMVGTPMYMSPEQAELSSLDVDTRSDIYSLGVLLYELLTGTTPFDKETLKNADFDEIRRMIREVEPCRPSDQVSTLKAEQISTISDSRKIDQRSLGRSLRGELDWIVMKTLEKDRTRRYETTTALADDVRRFLTDEAVLARPPSRFYRLNKFAIRNKSALVAITSITLSLAIGLGLSLWQTNRAIKAETKTKRYAREVEQQSETTLALQEFLIEDLIGQAAQESVPGADPKITLREAAKIASEKIGHRFLGRPLMEAAALKMFGQVFVSETEPESALALVKRELVLRREHQGPNHPDTLYAQSKVAYLLASTAKRDDAKKLLDATYRACQQHLPNDHEATIKTLEGYSQLCRIDFKFEKEAEFAHQALDAAVSRYGKEDRRTISIMYRVARANQRLQRFNQATTLFEAVRRLSERVIGEHSKFSLLSQMNIARIEFETGDVDAALRKLDALVPQTREHWGHEHAVTVDMKKTYADALRRASRLDQAEAQLLELETSKGAQKNPKVYTPVLGALATIYRDRADFQKWEEYSLKAYRVSENSVGLENTNIAVGLHNIGQAMLLQEKFEEASTFFNEAIIELESAITESQNPFDSSVRFSLGWSCATAHSYAATANFALNNNQAAIFHANRAIEVCSKVPKSQETGALTEALIVKAMVLSNTGKTEEAEKVWAEFDELENYEVNAEVCLWQAAQSLAEQATRLQEFEKRSNDDEMLMANRYTLRSLSLLNEYFDEERLTSPPGRNGLNRFNKQYLAQLKNDERFASLRTHENFGQLIERIEAAFTKQSERIDP
jgi:serine/threonine protein kinase